MVGCRWFASGEMTAVSIIAPTGFEAWVTNDYPAVTGDFTDDHDGDGIPNGVEYAFGLNPTVTICLGFQRRVTTSYLYAT